MRKFKFVGNPISYTNRSDDFILEKGKIYDGSFTRSSWLHCVENYASTDHSKDDWEEVTENNQDLPASQMTKFEMAVFMVVQGMCAGRTEYEDPRINIENAIELAKETFKQIEDETDRH